MTPPTLPVTDNSGVIGGGKANSFSILEAFELATSRTGKPMGFSTPMKAREGDDTGSYSGL